jgi:hypothetical protein
MVALTPDLDVIGTWVGGAEALVARMECRSSGT